VKRFFTIGFLASPIAAWFGYALLAHPVSALLAAKWGSSLLAAGDGKFTDATVFLEHRFCDAALLLSVTVSLLLVAILVGRGLARRLPQLWKWVPYSAAGLVCANLWLKLASGTCLFWLLFWNGKGTTDNLTQFHIKLLLMGESTAAQQVVLGGSSQVRTQIDHRQLNRELGPRYQATELHFPGNRGYDFLSLDRALETRKADTIVCYLSELNFFSGGLSAGFPLFLTFSDVPEFLNLGGRPGWDTRAFGYGLLGEVLPAFRLRGPIAQRFLGEKLSSLQQEEHDAELLSDLARRAEQAATGYRSDAQSDFHMAAFETFVAKCQAKKRTVVICCGQLNPVLAAKLEPRLRPQMLAYLRQLATSHDNVVLWDEQDLPRQTADVYEDLTHVGPEAQARFTGATARKLLEIERR
jgi:hypothetical protein